MATAGVSTDTQDTKRPAPESVVDFLRRSFEVLYERPIVVVLFLLLVLGTNVTERSGPVLFGLGVLVYFTGFSVAVVMLAEVRIERPVM